MINQISVQIKLKIISINTLLLSAGRSTIAHRHVIDRIERIIEPTEPNLTKNPNFFILVFRCFFGLQASYRAETLTPDRSRAPRRFFSRQGATKSRKNIESIESIDSIDRSRDRSYRSPAAVIWFFGMFWATKSRRRLKMSQ